MKSAVRLGAVWLMLGGALLSTGCETSRNTWRRVRHELQPHRLHRLNQWDGPTMDTGQFSVQDDVPQRPGTWSHKN